MPPLTSEAPRVSAARRVRRKKPKPGVTASDGEGLPWNHEVTGVQLGKQVMVGNGLDIPREGASEGGRTRSWAWQSCLLVPGKCGQLSSLFIRGFGGRGRQGVTSKLNSSEEECDAVIFYCWRRSQRDGMSQGTVGGRQGSLCPCHTISYSGPS